MADDPLIEKHEEGEPDARRSARAANLFDVRLLIGGLFAIYGLILLVLGIGASQEEIDKAAGVNLNLWVGLSMLVVAALFLVWAFTRPLAQALGEGEDGGGNADDRTVGSETTRRGPSGDRDRLGGQGDAGRE
jgi:hypothetical protein